MKEASKAMATWVGTLARGGVLYDSDEEAGVAVAAYVVGEGRLSDLREWMRAQPADRVRREQEAAIAACIWMAQADRQLDPSERELLEEIVNHSGLDYETQERLVASIDGAPSVEGLPRTDSHPVLRELLLALAWELALADGRIDQSERDFYGELATRLEVDPARAAEVRDALSSEVLG
jgi:tellurite resistance protein